jgi:dolichol kinase
MPLLYTSIGIFLCCSHCGVLHNQSTSLPDIYDATSIHLRLALFGGLSFAASSFYERVVQHRKSNLKRLQTNRTVRVENADNHKTRPSFIHQTPFIYLALLVLDLLCTTFFRGEQNYTIYIPIGLLHISLIASHPGTSYSAKELRWQNAFSQGEWMVVSTFVTTMLGEFFLRHVLHTKAIDLPDYINVAHAGLSGCILGIMTNSLLQRMRGMRQSTEMLTSLVMVVATTVGCLEVALDATFMNNTPVSNELFVPRSIQWLFKFLSTESNDGRRNYSTIPLRVAILVYWVIVLAVSIPISIQIASWTASSVDTCTPQKTDSESLQSTRKKRRVVIARKYFHLVALLLFAPITWIDRDMMCLSYAIAVALMLVMELVRSSMQIDTAKNIKNDLQPGICSLNQFYTIFFDAKDSSAQAGGIVISHVALVIGCAFPLWIYQLLISQSRTENSLMQNQLLHLLPHIGVVALGIGDSAGAIGGLSFPSPTRWPGGSSRTFEGSLCMLLSMIFMLSPFLVAGLELWDCVTAITLLVVLTLIEASTEQIDNMCMPIAASTVFILLSSSGIH